MVALWVDAEPQAVEIDVDCRMGLLDHTSTLTW